MKTLPSWNLSVVAATALVLAAGDNVRAADMPVKALPESPLPASYDWTGFYIGIHFGVAAGNSAWTATQPEAPNVYNGAGSQFGGLSVGYNFRLPANFIGGFVADFSGPAAVSPTQNFASPTVGSGTYGDTLEMFGSVRARVGRDVNHWLYYVTGGLAWTYDQFTRTQIAPGPVGPPAGTAESSFLGRIGWTAGFGVEVPVTAGWTAKAEYLYSHFGDTSVSFPLGAQTFSSDMSLHQFRVGLNYRPGDAGKSDDLLAVPTPLEVGDWAVHGQTTFVSQYAPPFHAPYRGPNSLDPNAGRETWDATLYVGRRLWEGAELWLDPEIDQGFGLSNTLGIAGFPSGEAYKVGSSYPYARLPRAFIRQTIDLGGDTLKVEDGINQFSGKQTADRLVITVGKFSVSDIFDTVTAHDPRNDFLNWSLLDASTFDYAADAWGFTYGAAAEWYSGNWTLRAGLFDLSIVPNSPELDHSFRQFQIVYEIEHRHQLWDQPGKVALVGYLSRGDMGSYADALALAAATGTTPSTAAVRQYNSRPGANINFDQQIVPNITMFGRFGMADGNVEPYEFTDPDRTASLGASFGGKLWGRPDDTIGIGGVANGISAIHAAYLNAGGLGILVGDGQLPHPGIEQIIETYYSLPVGGWKVTADYQFIVNPAFNRDRGPVSVLGVRLHMQF
jgi:high affinity Mn2+ porin